MKKVFHCIFLFLLVGVLSLHLSESLAFAQEQANLIISPPIFPDLTLKQGQQFTSALKVTNNANDVERINLHVENYTTRGETGMVVLKESRYPAISPVSWISFEQKSYVVPAHTAHLIPFTITIPKTAEPGGKYLALVASIEGVEGKGATSQVNTSLASLLLIKIPGNINYNAHLSHFQITPSFLLKKEKLIAEQKITNSGNVHIHIKGNLTIFDIFHHPVQKVMIDDTRILPGTTRAQTETFMSEGWGGLYSVQANLSYQGENKTYTLTGTASYFYLPLEVLISIILLIILGIGIFILRKNFTISMTKK